MPDDPIGSSSRPDGGLTSDATRTADGRTLDGSFGVPLEANAILDPYRLIRLLGSGGFGSVWEAEHLPTGRRLALKVLTAHRGTSPLAFERFAQEGRLAATLNHPRCVFVFGAEQIAGIPAVAMELMPGGTLQDRLNAQGRCPPREAVDMMLDVIDGLDAARRAGIVHRDIKPSNCFLDSDGRVKIGDFGISKSLDQEPVLTVSGDFVGTPFFASPEQVRGQDVDFRSDIYSAGATLYALLTGHPPFRGGGVGDVLARVLSEPPDSFAAAGVKAPGGLERVLHRMMARDPAKRYQDFESLRSALLPFSSTGLDAASLALRYLAYLIDGTMWSPVTLLLLRPLLGLDTSTIESRILLSLFNPTVVYFPFCEWRWGQTLGKYLVGLRVTTKEGGSPSLRQAFGRIAILIGLPTAGMIVVAMLTRSGSLLIGTSGSLIGLVTFLTMRPGNGFAGVHEVLTGTRVISMPRSDAIDVPDSREVATPDPLAPSHLGPYRRHAVLWSAPAEELLVAVDDVLRRNVWIHRFTHPANAALSAVTAGSDSYGLRWLAGGRHSMERWDAFEAPFGMGLPEWVALRGRLSWREMRPILLALAEELSACDLDRAIDRPLSVQHVWIDRSGAAKLLPFPVTRSDETIPIVSPSRFLLQVAMLGLCGRILRESELEGERPAVVVPDHAEAVLDALAASHHPVAVSQQLRDTSRRSAAVTRARRVGSLLVPVGAVVWLGVTPFVGLLATRLMPATAAAARTRARVAADVRVDRGRQFLDSAVLLLRQQRGDVSVRLTDEERRAHERIVAGLYGRMKQDATLPLGLSQPGIKLYEGLVARYPNVSDEELSAALALVGEKQDRRDDVTVTLRMSTDLTRFAGWMALVLIALSCLLRAPILRMAGLSVKRTAGGRATRVQHGVRAAIAAAPLLLPLLWRSPSPEASIWLLALTWALLLAGIAFALVRPSRGIPDLIARTQLAPR